MADQELTIREKSERVSHWFAFVGANLIAVMTYFILWVEDSRRLPVILALLPLQSWPMRSSFGGVIIGNVLGWLIG